MRTPRTATARVGGWAVLVVCLATALQACATFVPSPDPRFELHVDNGTTLPVSVVLNGREVGKVPAGTSAVVPLDREPRGIVNIEARLPGDISAIKFAVDPATLSSVAAGSVVDVAGAAHRVDLSCGRLDLWLLAPPLGPRPGPGTIGDCGPVQASPAPSSS